MTTQVVKTNGGGTVNNGQTEWDIDSQDIVGMGGGQVGQLIFYSAPTLSNADMTANFNTIVTANVAKIVNVSIGGCELDAQESGTAAATDQTLAMGDAQGQTFSISTGDSGADECGDGGTTPSWPADSPYAIAVAGTTLNASTGSSATYNSEIVWTGSGGSPSTFEPAPTWQYLLASDGLRGVADVAFDADPNTGTLIDVGTGVQQWGGTSLAAPIFSGLWARVLAVKGTDFGFAGPLIYQLPQADFHDVTTGNNGGEHAKVGYDFASGRGSIILSSAIKHIGVPIGQRARRELQLHDHRPECDLHRYVHGRRHDHQALLELRRWLRGFRRLQSESQVCRCRHLQGEPDGRGQRSEPHQRCPIGHGCAATWRDQEHRLRRHYVRRHGFAPPWAFSSSALLNNSHGRVGARRSVGCMAGRPGHTAHRQRLRRSSLFLPASPPRP